MSAFNAGGQVRISDPRIPWARGGTVLRTDENSGKVRVEIPGWRTPTGREWINPKYLTLATPQTSEDLHKAVDAKAIAAGF